MSKIRIPGMPDISLRPVSDADTSFLFTLYTGTRDDLTSSGLSQAQLGPLLRMQFDAQQRQYAAQFPSACFDLIRKGESDIGRLYVERSGEGIHVIDIALLPAYRGQGIGGALLQGVIDKAESMGLPVFMHVLQGNPAMHLYRRLGFERISQEGLYELLTRLPIVPSR